MKQDMKIFLRYIFDFKEFRNNLSQGFKELFSSKSLSQLFLILAITIVGLIEFRLISGSKKEWILAIVFFLAFIYFKYKVLYKRGEHIRWDRDKKGIPSKKQMVRKEFDLRKKEEVKESETSNIKTIE